MIKPLISVVIPVLNEAPGLEDFVGKLQKFKVDTNEIIVVDGGSTDKSLDILERLRESAQIDYLLHSSRGRAIQMNAGARVATGQVLLFLHSDTCLPSSASKELSMFAYSSSAWGRFDLELDNSRWPYQMIAWFINHRSRWSGIATGDQAIFVKREIFEGMAGFAEQPLMEDVALCVSLKKYSPPLCLKSRVTSSSRRWEQHGIIKTIWLMWRLRASYAMGASPESLFRQYYS